LSRPPRPEPKDFAPLYEEWQPDFNWETCKAGREDYGKFLCSYITSNSTAGGNVINLNGGWGTGKTHLLKRLYVELAEQHHPVVYINAWESDFSNDALSVVCSELLHQIGKIKIDNDFVTADKVNSVKNAIGKCFKYGQGLASISGNKALAEVLKGAGVAIGAIDDAEDTSTSANYSGLVDEVSASHSSRISAMREVKKELGELALELKDTYQLEIPIVFLVDELDRCRPTYAIEMLEVIKHFFETDNCVFLVATDTEALEHSVKALYGNSFHADVYLRRFFDHKIALPEISILAYLESLELNILDTTEKKYEDTFFQGNEIFALDLFSDLFEYFDLPLRDIKQILSKFNAALSFIDRSNFDRILLNYCVLMYGITEHHLELNSFKSRTGINGSEVIFTRALAHTNGERYNQPVNVSFNDFIELALSSVTLITVAQEHFKDRKETILSIAHAEYLSSIAIYETYEYSARLQAFRHQGETIKECNYYMWMDYKKIIGLTSIVEE